MNARIDPPTGAAPDASFADCANALRVLAMDAVQQANSGHPGMPMGMADVATMLFQRFITLDPAAPDWPDRDRFVLSAGHGSMLQYALHHLIGYADMPASELGRFRQLGARTAGHPEYGHALGIETTTGPLGQGIATAVGMAIAERMLAARYGDPLVDHRTYVIAGDGCLQEGISQEAIDLAGHLRLGRLIMLWDDNAISIDGPTSLSTSTDQIARFTASGWHCQAIDGHDADAIEGALDQALATRLPSMIACRTVIGKGAPNKQGTEAVHGAPLGADEVAAAKAGLAWPYAPFEIPDAVRAAWGGVGQRGKATRMAWDARLSANPKRIEFEATMEGDVSVAVAQALAALKSDHLAQRIKVATRKASEMALAAINSATNLTCGGSADLTHSNLTVTPGMRAITADDFSGRYLHYGIREHGMAAAMNGIALHGGFIPYGGTFLVFADYARGAIRLSALMGQRVIYVLTHDSIGLGEDGPTHQPIEHLAMLRATPNLLVIRPADAIETADAWRIALTERARPTALVLSRQALPLVREGDCNADGTERGAYVVVEPAVPRVVTLLATGSEVEIALQAAAMLAGDDIPAAVVSMPCWELFEEQDDAYRTSVLGAAPRVAVEAAVRLGWDRWIGDQGMFVGMKGFGASAPAPDLYRHFGITSVAVAAAARAIIPTIKD